MKTLKDSLDSITKPHEELLESLRNPLRSYESAARLSIDSLVSEESRALIGNFSGLDADAYGAAGVTSLTQNKYAEHFRSAENLASLATINSDRLGYFSGTTEKLSALHNAFEATSSFALTGLDPTRILDAAGLNSSFAAHHSKSSLSLVADKHTNSLFSNVSGLVSALRDELEATKLGGFAGLSASQSKTASRLVSSIADQYAKALYGPSYALPSSFAALASQVGTSFAAIAGNSLGLVKNNKLSGIESLVGLISSRAGFVSSTDAIEQILRGREDWLALTTGIENLAHQFESKSKELETTTQSLVKTVKSNQSSAAFLTFLYFVLNALLGDDWIARISDSISAAPNHPKQITVEIESKCTTELCIVAGTKPRRIFGEPRKSATVVTRISAGTFVRPLHQSGEWQLIEFLTESGKRLNGWIETEALEDFRAQLSSEIVSVLTSQNKSISKEVKKPETFAVPKIIKNEGQPATKRFLEFFAASIRNKNTRLAYAKACNSFLNSMENSGLALHMIEPLHIAVHVEKLTQERSPATVKQHVAAIRQMFDYLVTGQIIPSNPASSVKPPKHVSDGGKTPILQSEELRQLFASLNPDVLIDVRDRAILAVMTFSFARVGAVVKLRVRDYYRQGAQAWFLLREKGGRDNKVPVHHEAANYVEHYIELAGLADQREMPLFRSFKGRTGTLTVKPMLRGNVFDMIRRRAAAVGLPVEIGCHSFRGSGITNYLSNGGTLEVAARIAGHRSTTTTQLYDRRNEQVSQAEIERIRF